VSISISHSSERSLCAVSPPGVAIGCDLERIEARESSLVRDYFTSDEIAFCEQEPEAEKDAAVNLVWSAKESVLKVLREGLRRDTRSIRIHPDWPGTAIGWNAWKGYCIESSQVFHGWWRIGESYVYTLASDRRTSLPQQIQPRG
jgi:4'-phosphopantetheinyl transferase